MLISVRRVLARSSRSGGSGVAEKGGDLDGEPGGAQVKPGQQLLGEL